MAGSSSSYGSPITQLAQDHLFSILLLLPIDSILSFAMTCKKFQSLLSSDFVWESVCVRDWGHSCVDAIKSSYAATRQHLPPWLELYQRVTQLDSVSCHKFIDPVGEELVPLSRASHSLNIVSSCLILFGGGCEGGRHLDDTWVAYIGRDNRTLLRWQKIGSGVPMGRFGHTCVVLGDSLIVFGGINDSGLRQNDTWIGNVTRNESFGINLIWRQLDVGHIAPPPRGAHAGCCIDNKRMLVYGGIGLNGVRLGDTWILDLSENLRCGTWHEVVSSPSPPARSGHTLTCIGGGRTVLFAGRGLSYEVLGDVWMFDTSEGHPIWKQVLFDLKNIHREISLPRVGHSATPTLGGRVLIYGGEDSIRHRKDDFLLLDVNSSPSIKSRSSTSSRSFLMWRRLKADGYKIDSRSFHAACADHSGRYLYVFGGMVDGLVQPAGLSGLRFNNHFFLAELVLHL